MSIPAVPDARIRARKGGSTWQVSVARIAVLRELVFAALDAEPITRLELTVTSWRAPKPGWLGRPALGGLSSTVVTADGTGVRIELESVLPVNPGLLSAAALRCLQPASGAEVVPGPVQMTFVPGLGTAATPLAAMVRDALLPGEKRDRHVRRADDLMLGSGTSDPSVERARTFVVDPHGWLRDGVECEVLVDPCVHRPVGRRTGEGTSVATADSTGATLTVSLEGKPLRLSGDITSAQVRALREIGAITCAAAVDRRLAVQLNACGILVRDDSVGLPSVDDWLGWQKVSVAERRHALRAHSPAAAFDNWPSVSIVLATHRSDHLDHAFAQLRKQTYPRLEAVIGAHGDGVDHDRARDLARSLPFPARVISIGADANLGQALQQCSDAADGAIVTKMDDDDYYSAEHVWDLVLARMYSGAQVVGKALDWVYLAALDTTVLRPTYAAERYADFVAGGTMLIAKADLMSVGGWRPVPKSVDRALLDRVLADGGLVYRTHGLGYTYVRRASGHTATVADEHFLTKTAANHAGLVHDHELGTAEINT